MRGGLRAALLAAALLALAGPGEAGASRPAEEVITEVELHLPRGVDPNAVKQLVTLRAGQRLRRRALRQTVRLLYETRQFEQVRVHLRRAGAGVAVTFVLLPKRRLADLTFVGSTALEQEQLLRVSGLERDEPYAADRVERARKALVTAHARRGWRDVVVSPEVSEGDDGMVALVFRITQGERMRLSGLRFEGAPRLELEELSEAFGLTPGNPLDLEAVEAALGRLRARYRSAGFLRALVGKPAVEEVADRAGRWGRVVVPVEAGPLMRLRIEGNTMLTRDEVMAMLALPQDEPVSMAALEEAAARLERRYRLMGRYAAKVRISEHGTGDRFREVRIVLDEAAPLRVRDVHFRGVTAFDTARLREHICAVLESAIPDPPIIVDPAFVDALGGHRGGPPPTPRRETPEPCTVFDRGLWKNALEGIADLYRSRGWLAVEIAAPRLEGEGREAQVHIRVKEGVQTRVQSVAFEGAAALEERLLGRTTRLSSGEPLSYLRIEEARFALRELYARRGHPFAKIDDLIAFDTSRATARVLYRIEEGPEVRVGRVIVRGQKITPESLVRSRLAFGPGDVWDAERVRDSQRALLGLGIYRSAAVHLLDLDEPASTMDVLVTVSERRPQAFELGFGVSTEDGPRAFAEYTHLAFWWSSELNARAKVNYPIFPYGTDESVFLTPGLEWETHLGLRLPTLRDVRTVLVWERDNRPVYGLTRFAGSVGNAARLTDAISASLRLELEFEDLTKGKVQDLAGVVLTQRDRERLRLDEGEWLLASLRPAITVDLRDDPFRPRRGWLMNGALDWSKDLGIRVRPVHFVKATASLSRYQPGPGRITFAFSAQGGLVMALRADNHTVGPKRFFLGGADSMRGYLIDSVLPEDQRRELHDQAEFCETVLDRDSFCSADAREVVLQGLRPTSAGGEAYMLFKGEMRFPIFGALQGGLFLDVGNLWRDPAQVDPLALRTSAGAGLRYETPVGPVALDLGMNLAPDRILREDSYAVHFAIGLF